MMGPELNGKVWGGRDRNGRDSKGEEWFFIVNHSNNNYEA